MSRIKILEVIRQGQIGGGESHMLDLVKFLDKSTFDPFVLSFTDGPMVEKLKNAKISCKVITTLKAFDSKVIKEIEEYLKDEKINVLHAHGTRAMSNVYRPAKKLKIPIIYTIHGWSFHKGQSIFTQIARRLGELYLTKQSSLNISVSKSNQITGKNKLFSFHSTVINNGIDLDKFDYNKKFGDLREELNIKSNILIGFIARMTLQKAPINMLKAFYKVNKKNPEMHLLMVGDGELVQEVKNFIKQKDLNSSVTLISFRDDVPAVLSAIDIFCLPSLWEGLPLGLLEALAMKKAVIATDVDGTKEVIKDGYNGLLIKPNHINELTAALSKLISNKQMRDKLSEAGLNTVVQKYNVINMVQLVEEKYLAVYKNYNT